MSVKSHLTSGASVHPENSSRTQRATEVERFVGFSLKLLHYRDPPLKAIRRVGHFSTDYYGAL